jgi:hypothetical protein
MRRSAYALGVFALALIFAASSGSLALGAAPTPQWHVAVTSTPTHFTGPTVNEVQQVAVDATSGTFTLSIGNFETEPIPFNASDAVMEALIGEDFFVSSVGGCASVTGGPGDAGATSPYVVTFGCGLTGVKVGKMRAGAELLEGAAHAATVTVLTEASGQQQYVVAATNNGDVATDGSPITISDALPANMTATAVSGLDSGEQGGSFECRVATVNCTYSGVVEPGDVLYVVISVSVNNAFTDGEERVDSATVAGGGAPPCGGAGEPPCPAASDATRMSGAPSSFGVASYGMEFSSEQAGAHPNLTTSFTLNQDEVHIPAGTGKDIALDLPPGLVGNVSAVPQCDMERVETEACPPDTAVGVATVRAHFGGPSSEEDGTTVALIYNIKPSPNEPAAFAFNAVTFPIRFDTRVLRNEGGEYAVHVSVSAITEAEAAVATSATLWGVPARHNGPGSDFTAFGHAFGGPGRGAPVAFLRAPTACTGALASAIYIDSWQHPGVLDGVGLPDVSVPGWSSASAAIPAFSGCERLQFNPALTVAATSAQASVPAGYTVHVEVPQDENPEGLATADVRDAEVTLPRGTTISPSAANGLQACSEAQFGLKSSAAGNCPPAATIGSVKITTPLLPVPVTGHVFLGQPECAPCAPADAQNGKLVPLLLEAEGSGVIIKLAGKTSIDQQTGQLATTFTENPQLPFSDLELSLKGGEDAPLVNPSTCGPAIATAKLTPWSTMTATEVSAPPIPISGCSPQGFSPSLHAGMTSTAQAGGFSGFSVTLSRPDGEQDLKSVSVNTPPGLLGMLSTISRCADAQANAGTCPAASQIGTASTTLGRGTLPLTVTGGKVYLTGSYRGEPFGLSIVMPAEAGPFKLAGNTGQGTVVVRASIAVDPHTSALTITSDELPQQLDGIPLEIRTVNVDINREGFMFNPTNCSPMSIGGVVTSTSGTVANVSFPFQSVNCATLSFKPTFTVSTQAKTSKANGASLHVKVTSGPGEANIGKVKVDLPKQLPSRLTTLQKACPDTTFNANPASCPAGSLVGTATAITRILKSPLTGPAYLVSHAGAAFPDLVIVLQGEGITLDLVGNTDIKHGITISTFNSVPDAPISTFDLVLPEGPHSALAAFGNLCKTTKTVTVTKRVSRRVHGRVVHVLKKVKKSVAEPLVMPTRITGQNGAVLQQTTKVAVTGCSKPKAKKKAKPKKKGKGKKGKGKKGKGR